MAEQARQNNGQTPVQRGSCDASRDQARAVVECIAEGRSLKSAADKLRLSHATMRYQKERLAKSIREFFGEDVLALVAKQPEWKSNLRALREKHTTSVHDHLPQAASV